MLKKKDTGKSISRVLCGFPFFVDVHNIIESKLVKYDNHFTYFAKYFKSIQANYILVINFNSLDRIGNEIKQCIKYLSANEVAFRINSMILNSNYVRRKIDETLNSFNIKLENSHLIIDHQSIYENINSVQSVSEINSLLPYLEQWKSYSLIAGSFPENFSEFKGLQNFSLPRNEWIQYKSSLEYDLSRIPSFGDYTIQSGKFLEYTDDEKKQLNPSANIISFPNCNRTNNYNYITFSKTVHPDY